ncbi:hypothetical protein HDU96_007172 [Phlyctochytrium bullatum]|nr:hypothetical protein HDU96_007172 [Phlyctochytrium bullatum]
MALPQSPSMNQHIAPLDALKILYRYFEHFEDPNLIDQRDPTFRHSFVEGLRHISRMMELEAELLENNPLFTSSMLLFNVQDYVALVSDQFSLSGHLSYHVPIPSPEPGHLDEDEWDAAPDVLEAVDDPLAPAGLNVNAATFVPMARMPLSPPPEEILAIFHEPEEIFAAGSDDEGSAPSDDDVTMTGVGHALFHDDSNVDEVISVHSADVVSVHSGDDSASEAHLDDDNSITDVGPADIVSVHSVDDNACEGSDDEVDAASNVSAGSMVDSQAGPNNVCSDNGLDADQKMTLEKHSVLRRQIRALFFDVDLEAGQEEPNDDIDSEAKDVYFSNDGSDDDAEMYESASEYNYEPRFDFEDGDDDEAIEEPIDLKRKRVDYDDNDNDIDGANRPRNIAMARNKRLRMENSEQPVPLASAMAPSTSRGPFPAQAQTAARAADYLTHTNHSTHATQASMAYAPTRTNGGDHGPPR